MEVEMLKTNHSNHQMNPARGVFMASLAALLWGFLPIALKVVVEDVGAIAVSWFRFVIAFLILFVLFGLKGNGQLRIMIRPPWLLVVAGMALGVNYVAFLTGLDLTSPGNAQVVIQLAPITLALAGMFLIGERVSVRQGFGFVVALLGFVVFYRDQLSAYSGQEETYNWGILMVVLAAAAWVVYGLIQTNLVKRRSPHQLNLVIFGLPAMALIPLVDFSSFWQISTTNWILLIYMGLNTIAAYSALTEAFRHLEVSKVGIILAVNPVVTLAIMAMLEYLEVTWIDPERISLWGTTGASFILVGAIMAVKSHSARTPGWIRRFGLDKSLT